MINSTHKNAYFLNKFNGNIPRSGVTDQETINARDLCYQCSKDGPNFLFGKLRIRYSRKEPHLPTKIKLLSSQI